MALLVRTGGIGPQKEIFFLFLCGAVVIGDPLSENPALRANIEFELEAILSVQVVSQLTSDYYTNVSQGAWTVSY